MTEIIDEDIKVYTAKDVMKMFGCKEYKALNIIRALNNMQISEGVSKDCIHRGRISKKYFHEKIKI